MAEVDLGKVKMTDEELSAFILAFNGGLKFGKLEDGTPGYYKENEETGEEVLTPFKSGGGGAGGFNGNFDKVTFGTSTISSTTTQYKTFSATLQKKYKFAIVAAVMTTVSSYKSGGLKIMGEQVITVNSSTITATDGVIGGGHVINPGTTRGAIVYAVDFSISELNIGDTYQIGVGYAAYSNTTSSNYGVVSASAMLFE